MPLNKDEINQKLGQLEEYLQELQSLQEKPKKEFTKSSLTEAAAERIVYKACQQVIDIAQSVCSELGFGPPRFYRDLFIQLGQKKIIPENLQKKLEKMAGLRNKLAHEYVVIRPEEIYQVVNQDYQDLIDFAKAVAKYLR